MTYVPNGPNDTKGCYEFPYIGDYGLIVVDYENISFCPVDVNFYGGAIFCEVRAKDSMDSPDICPGKYIAADPRPNEIGTQCSRNVFNLWLDIYLVVETGRSVTATQLKTLSTALSSTLENINFGATAPYQTRITLITYGTLPIVRYSYDSFDSAEDLKKALDLSKHINWLDSKKNLEL